MNSDQTIKKSVTLYSCHDTFIQSIADKKFRGKFSSALQHVIERYIPLHEILTELENEKNAAMKEHLRDLLRHST